MKASWIPPVLVLCLALAGTAAAAPSSGEREKTEINKQRRLALYTPDGGGRQATLETEPNDDCATAEALGALQNGDINPAGDEDWYAFQGLAGDCVTLATDTYNLSSTDTQLYLYASADCADPNAYLVWDDDDGPGLFSLIDGFELPADDTYFVRVKHYSGTGTGEYELRFDKEPCTTPTPNDNCADAEPVTCPATVSGTTGAAANDLEDILEVCVPYGADGPDVFYEVVVPAGNTLTAILTPQGWDPALWFVADCADETTCVAGDDSGFFDDPETISWTNTTGSDMTLYVIPDGYYSGAHGPFSLELTCEEVVPVEMRSWGRIKTTYGN